MRRACILATLGLAAAGCGLRAEDNGPLYEAIGSGDDAEVRRLLAAGADPDSNDVASGLSYRVGVTSSVNSGRPPRPLVAAIEAGQPEIVQALIEAGAIVAYTDDEGFAPLEHAVQAGDPALVAPLLAAGADGRAASKHGFPLFFRPVCDGQTAIAAQLLDAGADLEARDAGGGAVAFCVGALESVFEGLQGRDALRIRPGATPLMVAAQRGHAELASALLARGADPDARDDDGRTALMLVAEEGLGSDEAMAARYQAIAEALLAAGADAAAEDEAGATALDRAQALAALGPAWPAPLAALIRAAP